MLSRLKHDDRGTLISVEMVLGITVLFSGTVAGMGTVRDAVVERFAVSQVSSNSLEPNGDGIAGSLVFQQRSRLD